MRKRKSWREKLADSKGLPKVVEITGRMAARWGKGTVVIPAPLEVDGLMRSVPEGRVTTMPDLCDALAKRHRATIGCPLTTGIFAWIAANAAEEATEGGEAGGNPFWRTLKRGGELNPKYPGGIERSRRMLEAEGHHVAQRGKKYFVIDFDKFVFKPF
jgi:alkylated DNA nucleotide flippase Atl1